MAAVVGVVALGALAACQPNFSDRMRGVHATFDDGRGTVTSAFGSVTPSGQHWLSVTVDQQYCVESTDELVRRSVYAQGYNAAGPDRTIEVSVSPDLEEASARLRVEANVVTRRWDGCDADPQSEPASELRDSGELRARLAWVGHGDLRPDRPGVDLRDAVAEGVVHVDGPIGRVRLAPSDDALLSAFDGIEE